MLLASVVMSEFVRCFGFQKTCFCLSKTCFRFRKTCFDFPMVCACVIPRVCMNVRETHIVFFYHVLYIWLYHLAEAVQARSSDPVRWSSGRKFRERRHLQDEMAVCVYAITCVCFCEF